MQLYAILCLCLVNFVYESHAKTVPLNMQVPIFADFRMTNLKEYIDNKISKELKKASETESKVEKLEDIISSLRTKFKNMSEIQDTLSKQIDGINDTASNSETKLKVANLEDNLSSLRTKFKNMSEIQDTLSKQIDGINDTASETESKVEKMEATLSSLRTKFKNMSEIQDTLSKQIDGINDTDTVKSLTEEINKIKQLQDKNIKKIAKILNIVDNSSNELQDVFGQTFYLMFTPNIGSAQLLLASSTNGVCNLHKLGTSSGEKITLHDKSSIKILKGTYNKQFKLHCNVSVKLFVLTGSNTWIDSYIALPKRYLGTEYLIPSYNQSTMHGPGTFLGIVSTKPTHVEIFGKDKRSKMFRKLSLDTEKSWYDYNNDRIDISGSYVKASTPVAVFSNIVCAKNNNKCHMFSDMVIPIRDYSKVFLIPHIKNVGKWTIRLYAKSTCNIKLFDKSRRQLFTKSVKNDTKFVEVQDGAMSSVISSCPSMVQLYGHATGNSISYMVLVPGIDKYLSYYYFMVPNYTSSLYIMIKTVHMKEIRIDESTYFPKQYDTFQDPTNPSHKYSVFSVPVSAGRHEVRTVNDAPFGLWIYGNGFGYPAGYGVKTL